jgi:tRNA uridine 5-carboxymethylaminomethyl modification enzyme
MFTSRAEYRLLLREDNADLRLRELGYDLGLVSEQDFCKFAEKRSEISAELQRLSVTRIQCSDDEMAVLSKCGLQDIRKVLHWSNF